MKYEVYSLTTSDFDQDEEGKVLSGSRSTYRTAPQAKKFVLDLLLKTEFDPSGRPIVVCKKDKDGRPLTVELSLDHVEISEPEDAVKRGFRATEYQEEALAQGKKIPIRAPFKKQLGAVEKNGQWVVEEIKPAAVAQAKK